MIKNLIVGLFTKYYTIEIFAPSNWDKGDYNKCVTIIDGLMALEGEDGNVESSETNTAFDHLNKLPEGTVITAYNKVLIKVGNAWIKFKPFTKQY